MQAGQDLVGEGQQVSCSWAGVKSIKLDTSKCLDLLALGPRALPTAAKPPSTLQTRLGLGLPHRPQLALTGLYSCSHPQAPGSASRLRALAGAQRKTGHQGGILVSISGCLPG